MAAALVLDIVKTLQSDNLSISSASRKVCNIPQMLYSDLWSPADVNILPTGLGAGRTLKQRRGWSISKVGEGGTGMDQAWQVLGWAEEASNISSPPSQAWKPFTGILRH